MRHCRNLYLSKVNDCLSLLLIGTPQQTKCSKDFQFSFGLDPNFAIPVPLDVPPIPVPDNTLFDPSILQNLDIPANSVPTTGSALLNEDDQKAFSQFLDTLITDQDMSLDQLPTQFSSLYESQPPPMQTAYNVDEDDEERRRNSILRSLDEQKRMHQRFNNTYTGDLRYSQPPKTPYPPSQYPSSDQWISSSSANTPNPSSTYNSGVIYLQKSDAVTPAYLNHHGTTTSNSGSSNHKKRPYDREDISEPRPPARKSQKVEKATTMRRKPHRELLTEEEKRANHIASEQKRRSTIRSGFKELTDIIPTLKNINNSKSTVLFKAVEFIKYLEKRNKTLREKVKSLEVRVQVEGRIRSMQRLDVDRITRNGGGSSSGSSSGSSNSNSIDAGENAAPSKDSGNADKSMAAALMMHRANEEAMQRIREELQLKSEFYAQQPATPTPRAARGFRPLHEESDARAGGYGPLPMYSSKSRSSSPSRQSYQHDSKRQGTKKPSSSSSSVDVEAGGGEEPLKATISA